MSPEPTEDSRSPCSARSPSVLTSFQMFPQVLCGVPNLLPCWLETPPSSRTCPAGICSQGHPGSPPRKGRSWNLPVTPAPPKKGLGPSFLVAGFGGSVTWAHCVAGYPAGLLPARHPAPGSDNFLSLASASSAAHRSAAPSSLRQLLPWTWPRSPSLSRPSGPRGTNLGQPSDWPLPIHLGPCPVCPHLPLE